MNTGKSNRFGVTLIEFVCVISIIGLLVMMLLPSIQATRESARRISCLNRLRQLGIGSANYESAQSRIPPGTLGFDRLLAVPQDVTEDQYLTDTQHLYYWKNTQGTSCLVLLLPYLGEGNLTTNLPFEMSATNSTVPCQVQHYDVQQLMCTKVSGFACPSDNLQDTRFDQLRIMSQPAFKHAGPNFVEDVFLGTLVSNPSSDESVIASNYFGCSGAHSGGNYLEATLSGYQGVMTCRFRIRSEGIRDGASNTIQFGESIGEIVNHDRIGAVSWVFGGLARGRGKLDWNQVVSGNSYCLGDSEDASGVGFGSMHPKAVNVVNLDGSTHSILRTVQLHTWYALCGRADGSIFKEEW